MSTKNVFQSAMSSKSVTTVKLPKPANSLLKDMWDRRRETRRRRMTRDVKWDRKQEALDWDRKCEIGDVSQMTLLMTRDRRHETRETGDMRQETWYRRWETGNVRHETCDRRRESDNLTHDSRYRRCKTGDMRTSYPKKFALLILRVNFTNFWRTLIDLKK